MNWFGRLMAAGALAAAVWPVALLADDDVPTLWVYQDWRLACPAMTETKSECTLTQDVLEASTRNEVARLEIVRIAGNDALEVFMPYNVLLEPGLGLGFDEDPPEILDYSVCDADVCVACLMLDHATMDKLKNSKTRRILFAGIDGKPLGLPFSKAGLAKAYSAFLRQEAGREHAEIRANKFYCAPRPPEPKAGPDGDSDRDGAGDRTATEEREERQQH